MPSNKLPENFFEELDWSCLVAESADQIARRLYSNGNSYSQRKYLRTSIAIEGLTPLEEDRILDTYPKLVDDAYRGWLIKRMRVIGKQAFIERAERAMKYGEDPQRLFISLIK